jgi:hypothetical protein
MGLSTTDESPSGPSPAVSRGAAEMVALEDDLANRAANVVVIVGPLAAVLVPGGKWADPDLEAGLISESLQLDLPQAHAVAV